MPVARNAAVNCRRPPRKAERPASRATTAPPRTRTARRAPGPLQRRVPEEERGQRDQRADGEGYERRDRGGASATAGPRGRDPAPRARAWRRPGPGRPRSAGTTASARFGETPLSMNSWVSRSSFPAPVTGVLLALKLDFRLGQLVLRLDRDVLAGRHRERPGDQPGDAGQHDRAVRAAATADPRDQRGVGDDPVHRAEDGRAQPSAADVPVLAQFPVGGGRLPGQQDEPVAERQPGGEWSARTAPEVTGPAWPRRPRLERSGAYPAIEAGAGELRVGRACRHSARAGAWIRVVRPVSASRSCGRCRAAARAARCHAAGRVAWVARSVEWRRLSRSRSRRPAVAQPVVRPAVAGGAGVEVRTRVAVGRRDCRPFGYGRVRQGASQEGWAGRTARRRRDVRPRRAVARYQADPPMRAGWSATGAPKRRPAARRLGAAKRCRAAPPRWCRSPCHAAPGSA